MAQLLWLSVLALGLVCSGLGMYGAFEFAKKLEGNAVTYIVLAAPVIAGAAAFIPPIAETTWRNGHLLKSLLWWLVLVPAGAFVFFAAAERVHVAKAGAEAERGALASAADRARGALAKTEAKFEKARADANRARGQKQCGPECRGKLSAEAAAQADVKAAETVLRESEAKAVEGSPLQAPSWLLPAALDAVAFMAIWSGLALRPEAPKKPVKRRGRNGKRTPREPKTADPRAKAEALFRTGTDDSNVIHLSKR